MQIDQDLLLLNDLQAQHVAELFSMLGDASRVKIIAALLNGPMNVQALANAVGISPSGISHHMRSLRQMHLVRAKKQGRLVFYSLDDEHVEELFQRGVDHVMHG
ncbi:MAG: helix-turn-helix transcriptional regulator [Chloroflexota bacterium]|nr:MAG: helix-turn-helix transcriptional regulator [Chloroflexota bacterium]